MDTKPVDIQIRKDEKERRVRITERETHYSGILALVWPKPYDWNDNEGFELRWEAYAGGSVVLDLSRDELVQLREAADLALADTREHWDHT